MPTTCPCDTPITEIAIPPPGTLSDCSTDCTTTPPSSGEHWPTVVVELTGDQNNFPPLTSTWWQFNPTIPINFTGIDPTGITPGTTYYITNIGIVIIFILYNNAGSSPGGQLFPSTGGDYPLLPQQTVMVQYVDSLDSGAGGWLVTPVGTGNTLQWPVTTTPVTTDQHNFVPLIQPNWDINVTGAQDLTGIVGTGIANGAMYVLTNTGTGTLTIRNDSGGSSVGNQLFPTTGSDLPLLPGQSVLLRRSTTLDGGSGGWSVIPLGDGNTWQLEKSTVSISSDQHNFTPLTQTRWEADVTGSRNLTGIDSTDMTDGRMFYITNTGTGDLTLRHNSGSSSPGNRFYSSSGDDITLSQYQTAIVQWSATANAWILTRFGEPAGGGGTLDHAALTSNLAWTTSGHVGTANRFAAFDGTGDALEVAAVGSGNVVLANSPTIATAYLSGATLFDNDGIRIADTDDSDELTIEVGSNLTDPRVFTLITGDADNSLDISDGPVTISSFGSSLVDDADAAAARATLEIDSAALHPSTEFPQWLKFSKSYTDYSTAATSLAVEVYSLPAKGVFHGFVFKPTAVWTAVPGAAFVTADFGTTGSPTLYQSAFSVTGAVSDTNRNGRPVAIILSEWMFDFGAATSLKVRINSNVFLNTLTAGTFDIWVLVSVLP